MEYIAVSSAPEPVYGLTNLSIGKPSNEIRLHPIISGTGCQACSLELVACSFFLGQVWAFIRCDQITYRKFLRHFCSSATHLPDLRPELELFYFGIFHPNQVSSQGSSLIEPNVFNNHIQ